MVVGAFFAIALAPVVGWVQRRVFGGKRRSMATLLVFVVVFVLLAALITAFVVPLAQEGTKIAGQLPQMIADAARDGARSATCSSAPTPWSGCRTTRTASAGSPAVSPPRRRASWAASRPRSPARSPCSFSPI